MSSQNVTVRVSTVVSRLFWVIWVPKCDLTTLDLNWCEFRDQKNKLEIFFSSAHLMHRAAKKVITSLWLDDNCCEIYTEIKNARYMRAKRAKLLFFIAKYANLRRSFRYCRLFFLLKTLTSNINYPSNYKIKTKLTTNYNSVLTNTR